MGAARGGWLGRVGGALARRREESRRLSSLLAEATDPATPADRLLRLRNEAGIRKDRGAVRLRDALAAHPNLPAAALTGLIERGHAAAFCRNPTAPLLALSDPEAILAMAVPGKRALLARGDAPEVLVTLLAQDRDPEVAEEARMHVALAGEAGGDACWRAEVVAKAQEAFDVALRGRGQRGLLWEMREYGLLPPWLRTDALPEEIDSGLPILSLLPDRGTRAPRPTEDDRWLSPRFLKALAKSGCHTALKLAVESPAAGAATLAYLARQTEGTNIERATALLRHPNSDARVLRALVARVRTQAVRRAALRHPAVPGDLPRRCRRSVIHEARRSGRASAAYFFADLHALGGHWLEGDIADVPVVLACPWLMRLSAVLGDQAGVHGELVRLLADDGNRLVRAAARARRDGRYRKDDLFTDGFGAQQGPSPPAIQ